MPDPNIPELIKSPYPATHIVDANGDIVSNFSGGGGSGGISEAQVQAAIEAATNLNDLEAALLELTATPAAANPSGSIPEQLRFIAENTGVGEKGAGIVTAQTMRTVTATNSPEMGAIGATNEAAPTTDVAASGLNGRLQRVAQRITSLINLLPASLGQKTAANSLAVVLSSDQALPLPTGAATEVTLNNILLQLQGDRAIASQLYSDSSGTIYLKVLAYNQQTNTYQSATLALDGTPYTPIGTETPLTRTDADTTETVWEITNPGTGYSLGDQVSQFTLISQGPPISVLGVIWYNQNTSTVIGAPLAGHRRRVGAVVATENTLAAVRSTVESMALADADRNDHLANIRNDIASTVPLLESIDVSTASTDVHFGSDATDISQPSDGIGVRGWLGEIYRSLTSTTGVFARLTDGGQNATIKPGSTAAVPADTALVTVLSPNQGPIEVNSELPSAVLLADNLALPTAPIVGGANLLYDGTNLDLMRSGAQLPERSAAVALAQAVQVLGAATVALINTDLLTGTINGWYDARLFKSCSIQIIGAAGITAGQIIFEQTNDPTNAPTGNIWAIEEDTSLTPTPIVTATAISANSVRMFRAPITAGWVRVRVSTAFAGGNVRAISMFSQSPYSRMIQTVAQQASGNLNANIGTMPNSQDAAPALINDVAASVINANTTTGSITPSFGNSYEVVITTSAPTAAPNLVVAVEESPDNGITWREVYRFPAITTAGIFYSGRLTLNGTRIRYAQIFTGTGTITRAIGRIQKNTDAERTPIRSVRSTALSSNLVLKVGAGNCFSVQMMSTNPGYLMLFDAAAVPGNGTVTPITPPVQVSANQIATLSWEADAPLRFDNGLVAVLSTTNMFTLTQAGATGFFGGQVL